MTVLGDGAYVNTELVVPHRERATAQVLERRPDRLRRGGALPHQGPANLPAAMLTLY
ncbi:hypothetical protein OG379_33970 [Streptomyces sp. NBC_01166]|uniref:hypothetical protein n=1 Tax=Streptomyces sp. NBC_01166 TaxID=2903755 RepID=UPI00386BABDD|nr:hypothetical protein OG379_33970 [Streptomyces sp. NBC_01166]